MTFDKRGFYREVGIQLRALREARDLTQQDLASILKVSRATYANIETGRQSVSLDVAWKIAVFFRVPLDKLTPEPIYGASPSDPTASPDTAARTFEVQSQHNSVSGAA